MARLEYPLNKDEREDWFYIKVYKYKPGKFSGGNAAEQAGVSGKLTDEILLPLPSELPPVSQSSKWGDTSITPLSAAVAGAASATVSEGAGAGIDAIKGEITRLGDLAKSANNIDALAQAAGNQLAKSITNQGLSFQDTLSRFGGIRFNENVELTFGGMKLRNGFPFIFQMTPRSESESKRIVDIIRLLKETMTPPKGVGGISNGTIIKVPNIYNISYRRGKSQHPFLNSFKTCALTSLNTKFGGMPYMSYRDGAPVSIELVLTFQELTPIYREDYDDDQLKEGRIGVGF